MIRPVATLSPSVHESVIKRHMTGDDDPVLGSLFDAVKLAREMSGKAAKTTASVLQNKLETEAARHRKARAAGFALLENATAALDAAVKSAEKETAAIKARTAGPPVTRDLVTETRQRELRERLSLLPEERRKAIIAQAVSADDDLLVAAVLAAPGWLSGLTDTDLAMVRHNWASRRYAPDLERLERLGKAIIDAQRAGQQAMGFVDSLTDAELISAAEASEKEANDALAAARTS